mgnify:CR=1 FL=1
MTVRELLDTQKLDYNEIGIIDGDVCSDVNDDNLEREVESFTLDYLEHWTEFNIYLKPKRN